MTLIWILTLFGNESWASEDTNHFHQSTSPPSPSYNSASGAYMSTLGRLPSQTADHVNANSHIRQSPIS
ncbi:hypothetical protein E1B28_006894 [Marasmius oreades]|uniref:Uncharacterized protein n=1 Tax=Marasmius oreades TaxID=181124 RepID=A0A9P7S0Q2_9AGAR|nr:uncharacterized protein E1B28_006894 [Marasmius oreades]KAG7093207.1 hypothetical protein E1B28_006894 [Marasmius oreades]